MKREVIASVKDHLKSIASGLSDMAGEHKNLADNMEAGKEQRQHSDWSAKCAKLGGMAVACHKAMEDGADTEPSHMSEGNRGVNFGGGGLDGPKILVGGDLAKAYDEINKATLAFAALPDIPKAVLRPGMRPLPEVDPSAALDEALAKLG
jgi:hypothetical protein